MKEHIHFGIALIINIALVGLIINYVWTSDSDKSIFIFIIFYPMLTLLNAIIWIMMRMGRDPMYHVYKWTTLALIVAFIPMVMLVGLY
jgi:hypothetical protein